MATPNEDSREPEISIILPCLNEEESLDNCLDRIKEVISKNKLNCEVILVNNGSTDKSREIAERQKESFPELIILNEPNQGYGSAYLAGLTAARGSYFFMADVDNTYEFNEIPNFVNKLKEGFDLVLGNRFKQKMDSGAMPWLHRKIGNPMLSLLVKIFFKVNIHDIHCGMRAMKKSAFCQIILYTRGMEFASEMVIKAAKKKMKLAELPIKYMKRKGTSKLRSWRDGWRHLRFILLYSPTYLFLLPGSIMFGLGLTLTILFYAFDPNLFGIQFYFHPMFITTLLIIVGYQFIFFTGFARIYAITHLGDQDSRLEKMFKYITIEKAGLVGILTVAAGLIIYLMIFIGWINSSFDALDQTKNSIIALALVALGIQTISSAFMLSILGIKEK